MLFNSNEFLIFLPVVFLLYWFVFKTRRQQNVLLLIASYFFYSLWDYRFLFLLMFSTFLDYYTGLQMAGPAGKRRKRIWLLISVCANLGFLGVFKYYNFFAESFSSMVEWAGIHTNVLTLSVILPVGISFYTFHGLSYVFDIYNDRIKPERDFVDYSLFVSFFPLLVAGPIERATHLLPQFKRDRRFSDVEAISGIELIIWGLFKKVVIADSLAGMVNEVFTSPGEYGVGSLLLASVGFSFQIYGDFSGYSDIAIGTAKLFGVDLLCNFNFPYLSRNIAEFWRRWHISLSSWFRDYVYIPLGGSRGTRLLSIRNIFVIFIVSGFWHGANWTFLIWGLIHALLFLPSFIFRSNRKYNDDLVSAKRIIPSFGDALGVIVTFSVVTLAWIFFRSASIGEALTILSRIFSGTTGRQLVFQNTQIMMYCLAFGVFFLMSGIILYRRHGYLTQGRSAQYVCCLILMAAITVFGQFSEKSFIYFQF